MKTPVIAIFDVGKTNKKLFLFDENYRIVYEKTARFIETTDEDGDPCENLESLKSSVFDSLKEVFREKEFDINAINVSAYGASFVHIDDQGEPVTPLYNYLKEYPEKLKKQFYNTYGGEKEFAQISASPVLGNLNSGMQLYRLKYQKPEIFKKIKYALHLPQYISYLISGKAFSEITSIGCHTNLWDFTKKQYHYWVQKEGVLPKLPPIIPSDKVVEVDVHGKTCKVGIGLHDSSAALIPYLVNFNEPFVLISSGTWCISLNPFNNSPLTDDELQKDCLSYIQYKGQPVKAARLFAGFEHEQQSKRIASHFNQDVIKYRNAEYDSQIIQDLKRNDQTTIRFADNDLSCFKDDIQAYHQLIVDLVSAQYKSTQLILDGTNVKRIFVDGGFSKNSIYMNLLALFFKDIEVYAASMAQATAIGAALAIHSKWSTKPLPNDIIELKYYSFTHPDTL